MILHLLNKSYFQLTCTMEKACTPELAKWPQCSTKVENKEGRILHTMEVEFGHVVDDLIFARLSSMRAN